MEVGVPVRHFVATEAAAEDAETTVNATSREDGVPVAAAAAAVGKGEESENDIHDYTKKMIIEEVGENKLHEMSAHQGNCDVLSQYKSVSKIPNL